MNNISSQKNMINFFYDEKENDYSGILIYEKDNKEYEIIHNIEEENIN